MLAGTNHVRVEREKTTEKERSIRIVA